ncbi:MAG: cytosine deaminase [Clostridiales bacterium]|nr:cytosine deaminase [Clostridiales bacterium]
MLVKNAKLRGNEELQDILIQDGKFVQIGKNITADCEDEVLDAGGNLVCPPYVDTHCHLDYVGTSGLLRPNMSGTLFEAIDIIGEQNAAGLITRESLKENARRVLNWQIANGTQFIRTHVNTDEEGLVSTQVLIELREELKDYITIQIVAFPQLGVYKYENALENLEKALQMGVDVIGAIPHFEDTREDGLQSLQDIFALAKKYDVLVDVHCDEIDDEQSRFVETVASMAIKTGLYDKVTASHTTAMGSYNNAYTFKLFSLLQRSKINIICNAPINITLQGRGDTYPKRRGITRVKELLEAGINVSMGTDDIMDPCYPFGTGNMLEVLLIGIHVCHLTGYNEIYKAFDLITDNGAKTMQLADYGIEEGKPANFLILSGKDEMDVIRRMSVPLYSVHNGKVLAACAPKLAKVYAEDTFDVDFTI